MRNLLFFILLMIVSNSSVLAQKVQDSVETKDLTYFKRVTLVVSDLNRSLKIYKDILGFRINSRKRSSTDSYSYPVFRIPKEAQITFATLDSPEQNRTIGLTEVKGIELPKNSAIHMSASVIKVGDLKSCIEQIKELGLDTTKLKMANNGKFTFNEQAFVDFDGHLIVLYEILEN